MGYLMGIDVATTGAKCLIADEEGTIVSSAVTEYPLHAPQPGWAEQDPDEWWRATVSSIRGAMSAKGIAGSEIAAVGLTGQMHSSVFLDGKNKVLRPAILWCDQRTGKEVDEIHERFGGRDAFIELTLNPALTGFTLPKVLWLEKNEPETYGKVRKILLPKDYVRFRLTGEFATDVSDASGTSMFDVRSRDWSDEILKRMDLSPDLLPAVFESSEVTGAVTGDAASGTCLAEGTPVVAGAGDQAASALSCGICIEGIVSVTLGTSGVIFASTDTAKTTPGARLHSFCHSVRGKWHLMGVMLSAGGSLKWFCDTFAAAEKEEAAKKGTSVYDLITAKAADVPPGSQGALFLPYLTGERAPHQDPDARGVFCGLSLTHTKAHLARAVLEGVAFGLRDSLELLRDAGIAINEIRLVGGGARSPLWRSIFADVFESPLSTVKVEEGAPYGALLLAGVGCKTYQNELEAAQVVRKLEKQLPHKGNVRLYREVYERYRSLYPALKEVFKEMAALQTG